MLAGHTLDVTGNKDSTCGFDAVSRDALLRIRGLIPKLSHFSIRWPIRNGLSLRLAGTTGAVVLRRSLARQGISASPPEPLAEIRACVRGWITI